MTSNVAMDGVTVMPMAVRRMREEVRRGTHRWAVVLDGNEGPYGAEKIAEAQKLLQPCVSNEQTLVVLSGCPEGATETYGYPAHNVITRKAESGSLAGMVWSLLHLIHLDHEAVVVFFPSSHAVSDGRELTKAIHDAFDIVQSNLCPQSIIILGTWDDHGMTMGSGIAVGLNRSPRFWDVREGRFARF